MDHLFSSLQQVLTEDIKKLIHMQINSIQILLPILSAIPITELSRSQYYCMQTIKNYMGPKDIDVKSQEVRCAFCIQSTIIDMAVKKYTSLFLINNGAPAINLDSQMFEKGQAYIAISRYSNWNNVKINSLIREEFAVDKSMINEYERLEAKTVEPLPLCIIIRQSYIKTKILIYLIFNTIN
ncbi:hypothetical protein C1646_759077 [Rhizophagus diaphanus]|nr:hypothetical protein C1646_759077 [Rhizophagus diaphanus] [Rhizophagus sp. MUCL 43196]